MSAFDQEIVQDFLTESGELLEQLDKDLVALEQSPRDPDLLNQVFRALHTIKGSASFLALTNLVNVAHAAESALNSARSGQIQVDKPAMDLLLGAVDVLKKQFANLSAGEPLVEGDASLIEGLIAVSEGRAVAGRNDASATVETASTVHAEPAKVEAVTNTITDTAVATETTEITPVANPVVVDKAPVATSPEAVEPASSPSTNSSPRVERIPLRLDESKSSLIEFLVADLRESATHIEESIFQLADVAHRPQAGARLVELGEAVGKTAVFFDFSAMARLAESVVKVGTEAASLSDAQLGQATPRLLAIVELLREQADGLAFDVIIRRPIEGVCESLSTLLDEGQLPPERTLESDATPVAALVRDGVVEGERDLRPAAAVDATNDNVPATPVVASTDTAASNEPVVVSATIEPELTTEREAIDTTASEPAAPAVIATIPAVTQAQPARTNVPAPIFTAAPARSAVAAAPAAPAASAPSSSPTTVAAAAAPTGEASEDRTNKGAGAVEQTIRVEVGRLESLLNLVGELVLQKNRLSAIARSTVAKEIGDQAYQESFGQATGSLDRVTSDLQVAVMRTRMQPLDKLFGKYPRLIRDLSRKTGKDMRLVVEGGETEVDKSVIEELGDPLVHILRNSADHGVETPEERLKAGKPAQGTITLAARHEGSDVVVEISDDGRGLSRSRIGRKAVERGLVTEQVLAQMSDAEVNRFIFAAGFSTAEQVTDLSGRGVGMDVVRTNIEKIKGVIELDTKEGRGTTIRIKIPLTVAILTAMMVRIGTETYALPLSSIVEIVRPEKSQLATIHGAPVMRLREAVLPLMDGCDVFGVPESKREPTPFAVVIASGERRTALLVTRLIGQQEVVVKPLDHVGAQSRSGTSAHADAQGPISGATVRDDGGVSLIVDVNRLVQMGETRGRINTRRAAPAQAMAA